MTYKPLLAAEGPRHRGRLPEIPEDIPCFTAWLSTQPRHTGWHCLGYYEFRAEAERAAKSESGVIDWQIHEVAGLVFEGKVYESPVLIKALKSMDETVRAEFLRGMDLISLDF